MMDAGRELDALVAERVMAWRRCHEEPPGSGYWEGRRPENLLSLVLDEVPRFSTDLVAAWQVAENMSIAGLYLTLSQHADDEWEAWFHRHISHRRYNLDQFSALGDTAPHAICLVALTAVGLADAARPGGAGGA
jgi:hypothetical protein